jgi:hypothetical protein
VAVMAGEGLDTNREIALALFVTPKTVDVHLSLAYRQARHQLPLAAFRALFCRFQIQERRRMSVHAQLLQLLADGEWHSEADLLPITPYPLEWMTELRHDGYEVVEDPAGLRVIRIREGSAGAP